MPGAALCATWRLPAFSAIRVSGDDCILDFTTAVGTQYDLQSTSNLAGNFWSPVATNIPGNDGTTRIIDTNAASATEALLPGPVFPLNMAGTRWNASLAERVFVRFYARFDSGCGYVHHFVT